MKGTQSLICWSFLYLLTYIFYQQFYRILFCDIKGLIECSFIGNTPADVACAAICVGMCLSKQTKPKQNKPNQTLPNLTYNLQVTTYWLLTYNLTYNLQPNLQSTTYGITYGSWCNICWSITCSFTDYLFIHNNSEEPELPNFVTRLEKKTLCWMAWGLSCTENQYKQFCGEIMTQFLPNVQAYLSQTLVAIVQGLSHHTCQPRDRRVN